MGSAQDFETAARRGADWLLARLQADGGFADTDLTSYHKAPAALGLAGHPRQARRLLELAVHRFRTPTGDFLTAEGTKSANPVFAEFWSYPNGWLALAAHRLGWPGVAWQAYEHLLTYRTPDGGFSANNAGIPDAISTAHLGQLALTLGDLDTARAAGDWLSELLFNQPDPATSFHLRADASGPLTTDESPLHVLRTGAEGQPYFMIGYPMAFLTRLHQVGGDPAHVTAARLYADYAFSCGPALRGTVFSHKVGWGAAVLARHTGETRYRELAVAIAGHLVSAQAADGSWSPGQPVHQTMDDTAEITYWLLEIAAELPQAAR